MKRKKGRYLQLSKGRYIVRYGVPKVRVLSAEEGESANEGEKKSGHWLDEDLSQISHRVKKEVGKIGHDVLGEL